MSKIISYHIRHIIVNKYVFIMNIILRLNFFLFLTTAMIFFSCKTKLDINPIGKVDLTVLNYSTKDINSLSKNLEMGFLFLFRDETIKITALYIASKGDDGYFWIPLEKLEELLLEQYEISLSNKFNEILCNEFGFDANINHYQNIITALNEMGSAPHIYVPNLDMLTNSIIDESGQLIGQNGSLSQEDMQLVQSDVYTCTYLNHNTNLLLHKIQGDIIQIESDFSEINNRLIFIIATKIIDPCIYPGCDDEYAHIRNCIVNVWGCKVCNEALNHNSAISDNATGNFGEDEIQIKLGFNAPQSLNEINECIYYEHPSAIPNLPSNYYLNNNKSYAILRSLNNFTYYHPNQGSIAQKIKKTKLPIKYFTDVDYFSSKDVNKLTLCYRNNEFNIIGDNIYNNRVLAGGLYQIRKYNGMPLYFMFPGHIPGGMFWINGADNIIKYDVNSNGNYCANNNLSIQESFGLSPSCDFCNNNIFGIGDEYFVNTSLNFLMNYWNKDTIIVGIARNYNNNIMPVQNYAKFGPGNVNCNINFLNKTKVAELKSYADNSIDHYILFNNQITYNPGTVFYIKIQATFESGNSINNCSTITTNSTYNSSDDLLRAVSLFPRGSITSLNIEIYI